MLAEMEQFSQKDMSDFVSPRTIRLFNRLSLETNFLKTDPSTWPEREDFCAAKNISINLNVVNDAAERALKLMTDFNLTLTQDEDDKQFLLQAIEYYRHIFPSHTKSSLISARI